MSNPQPAAPLVACDVEGTFTTGTTWEGLRDYFLEQEGRSAYRRFFRRRLPGIVAYRLGIGDSQAFKEKWVLGLLELFAGYTVEEFAKAAAHAAGTSLWPRRRPAVVAALRRHLDEGATVVLASGVFQPVLEALVARAAAEGLAPLHALGTPLAVADGRLTGRTTMPLSVGAHKAGRLQAWAGGRPLAAAYGDTGGDIPMLRLSAQPVAVEPSPALSKVAQAEGWTILAATSPAGDAPER